MWSIGVILFILLSGDFPFSAQPAEADIFPSPMKDANLFASEKWNLVSEAAKHLISQLLEVKVDKRICAASALKHPWIVSSSSSSLVDLSCTCVISAPKYDGLNNSTAHALRYKNPELGILTSQEKHMHLYFIPSHDLFLGKKEIQKSVELADDIITDFDSLIDGPGLATPSLRGKKRTSLNHEVLHDNKDQKPENSKITKRSSSRIVAGRCASDKYQPKITDVFKVLTKTDKKRQARS